MKPITFLLLILVVSVTDLQLAGQTPTLSGILAGKVTDGKGNILPGIKVFVHDSKVKREITTDYDGKYRLELPAGGYVVRAGTDCTQTFYQEDVRIVEAKTTSLDITVPFYSSYAAHVSIYQLIANPEKYHNRSVVISGYYRVGFELSALFASRDDADYLIGKNSLWVTFSNKDLKLEPTGSNLNRVPKDVSYFDGKYVLMEGIFNKDACGHMGMSSGEIRSVSRIIELKRFSTATKDSDRIGF